MHHRCGQRGGVDIRVILLAATSLFLEHTLLVNSAEIIGHLVLGVDVTTLTLRTLLEGEQFAAAGLYGAVDRDFFDWVLEIPGGEGSCPRWRADRLGSTGQRSSTMC